MISTPDGRTTLTAGLTTGDADVDPAQEFPKALDRLIKDVFCGGQVGAGEEARPVRPTG